MNKRLSILLLTVSNVVIGETTTQLEPMTVIGSSINSVDTRKLLPISTLTTQDIKKTGVRTINDLLKYMPEVDFVDTGSQNGLSTLVGTASVRLRGLSERNTLVLLNGHRLVPSSISGDINIGNVVDINQIPLSSIERVEVLKTGSSAVYGSDAVAGVVNFITRKEVKNANVFGNYGISSHGDAEEKNTGFTAGFGDLDKDHHNTFFSFEYFKREPIYRADRSLTQSVDYRRLGGEDRRSSSSPQGNILDQNFVPTGQSVQPCPPGDLNGLCRYNYNNYPSTEIVGSERYNIFAQNQLKFNATTTLNTEFIYSKTITNSQNHPVPDVFTLANGEAIRGRFMQGGNRLSDSESDMFQITSTLQGVAFNQFWEISAGYGNNSNDNRNSNYYLRETLNQQFASGALNPTVTTNNQALIDSLKIGFTDRSSSELIFTNLKFEGDLLSTEQASLNYAAGMQWRHESLTDTPDAIAQTDKIAGSAKYSPINTSRDALSGFSELNLQLFDKIDMQAAVRYDGYDSAENISPSFAISYTPVSAISFHANWGQSFLMPAFRQIYGQGSQSAVRVQGNQCQALSGQLNAVCNQFGIDGFTATGNNLNLKPERATSWTAGIDFKPFSFLSGYLNYWQISKEQEIYLPNDYSVALRKGNYTVDNKGRLLIDISNDNLASSNYKGIDAGLNFQWDFEDWGKLSLNNTLTYYLNNKRKPDPYAETQTLLNYASNIPPWRFVSTLTWAMNDWTTSLIVRSTSGFLDTFSYPTPSTPAPADARSLSSHTEADLIVSYSGIKSLNLTGGVKNFTNAEPPFSNAASQQYFGFGHAPLYDNRGAYFFLTANYQFEF